MSRNFTYPETSRRKRRPWDTGPFSSEAPVTAPRPWYRSSTLWIFVGLILGVVLGGFLPQDQHPLAYDTFRFLSKAFISLIKGLIVPLLLSTIIVGIAQTGDIRPWAAWAARPCSTSRSSPPWRSSSAWPSPTG